MASKKPKKSEDKKELIRRIYAEQDLIELKAQRMYDTGQGVSITKMYHEIKDKLGLPGHYDFDYGDAIKDILREAGWVQGGRS
jgi:hypothetical protein